MPRNIHFAASLPATAVRLYEMYVDAKLHAAFTGHAVEIAAQPGAAFSAFDGILTGQVLHVVPGRCIVQTWRSANWGDDVPDSVLVLTFVDERDASARIELSHVNVPDEDFAGVSEGWHKFYWQPWRAYLEKHPV